MLLVGQRLHISHDHHLIRSWGIRHEKRFDVDEVLYQHCVKKLLVGYLRAVLPATIVMEEHLTPEPTLVLADVTQLHQIVMNLGVNAEYAMRDQGGHLAV